MICKGKSVPLQAWSGPDGSGNLRFPDYMTMAEDCGKVVSLTHRPPLPPGNTPGTEMSHPRCVYINNRCRYQSITQRFLKRCLIKDDSNYMFRPIPAIIRFSSEIMMVVLYRNGS